MQKYSTDNDQTQKGCHLRPMRDVSLGITWFKSGNHNTRERFHSVLRVSFMHMFLGTVRLRRISKIPRMTRSVILLIRTTRSKGELKKSRDCAIKGATIQGSGNCILKQSRGLPFTSPSIATHQTRQVNLQKATIYGKLPKSHRLRRRC